MKRLRRRVGERASLVRLEDGLALLCLRSGGVLFDGCGIAYVARHYSPVTSASGRVPRGKRSSATMPAEQDRRDCLVAHWIVRWGNLWMLKAVVRGGATPVGA